MRLIKVPENKIPVRYEDEADDGKIKLTIKQENFFWYVLKAAIRQQLTKMSGLDILEFEDCHKEIMAQDGKVVLKITRESEYEKVKGWIENLKGWPGSVEDIVKDVAAVIRALRDAEKVKEEPKAPKK